MANFDTIVQQLKKERDQAKKTVQRMDAALAALSTGGASNQPRKGGLSAAARARIAAAQRARWAKLRANKAQTRNTGSKETVVSIAKKRPTLSAAARKKIATAQRARWAKIKAAQKKSA